MHRVVLDTNVVVSAVLSPKGIPAEILKRCFSNFLQILCSSEILDEYKRVLSYGKLNIETYTQTGIIDAVREASTLIVPTKSTIVLPHESDRIFYDTAKTGEAVLITGNIKHFPNEPFIMTPSDFMREEIESSKSIKGLELIRDMRAEAQTRGFLTDEEIEAEVQTVRVEKKR